MITLITGGPGTGKTAWLLSQLLELRKNEPEREFYIHGIRNLRGLPHEQIFCDSQLCDICRSQVIPEGAKMVENWPDWKTVGSLIVVDEVQRIWRPRASSSKPPDAIAGLETHRHYGIDFWLISQGPHLFDGFIRLLVGRHVHLVAKWNGRTQYEWPECKQNIQSRTDAVLRPYSLPKHVYNMYDSAEVHTKQEKRKPLSFYATIAAVIIAVGMGGLVYKRISGRLHPEVAVNGSVGAGAATAANASAAPAGVPPVPASAFPDFKPVIEGLPESAPAYSGLIKVSAVPLLAGCINSKATDKCTCYTAQATPYPASQAYCKEMVAAKRFNPYLQSVKVSEQKAQEQPLNKENDTFEHS